MRKICSIVIVLLFFISAGVAQSTYYPDAIWQKKDPAALKVNKVLLEKFKKIIL